MLALELRAMMANAKIPPWILEMPSAGKSDALPEPDEKMFGEKLHTCSTHLGQSFRQLEWLQGACRLLLHVQDFSGSE